ncbi:MAG: tetratricopeptide repeat protein [Burkholderiaceae bacterium]
MSPSIQTPPKRPSPHASPPYHNIGARHGEHAKPALDGQQTPLPELMTITSKLQEQGQLDEAVGLYQSWILKADSPHKHIACFNLGTILSAMHNYEQARQAYQQALDLAPGFSQANLNLGHQFEHLKQYDDALAQWQIVIERYDTDPSGTTIELYIHALNNSARLLEQERELERAEALMVCSLNGNPNQPDVIQHYVHIRQKQCKWPIYQPVGQVTLNQMLMATSALATMGLSDDPALQLLSAYSFVSRKVSPDAKGVLFKPKPSSASGRKIRVGYLSGDLCLHAMGLLIPELLELHDRNRFEIFGFCWSREDNTPERQRLLNALDKYVRIADQDDLSAARTIAANDIDILVDLHGLSSGARPEILGFRPAPIQIGYLGLPATSAVPGVDYMIGDPYVMGPEYQAYCTEKPMIVPVCYQVSDRQRNVAPTPDRATYQLPENAFVFCSFNNNHKFTETLFGCWMQILNDVPNSVLWLLADNKWSQENMLRCADKFGVDRNRLIFAPRVAPAEYRARIRLADLFLDTFPYNAGATASDVLWVGTPLLTLSGRTYISRMAGSLLTSVGLPDLITTSLEEYRRRAIELGLNPARVRSYRRYLDAEGHKSRLFDVPSLVKDIEAGFISLCEQSGRLPTKATTQ